LPSRLSSNSVQWEVAANSEGSRKTILVGGLTARFKDQG